MNCFLESAFFAIMLSVCGLGYGQQVGYQVKIERQLCSRQMDFAPRFFGKSESKLIYASAMAKRASDFTTNLYYSEKRGRKWSKPRAIIQETGKFNAGVPSIDTDRNVMFYTKCCASDNNENGACRIYYAYLSGDLVGESFELEIPMPDSSKLKQIGHPYFSSKFQILLFSSDMAGGQGDLDVWYSKYDKSNDSWGKPVNMGPEVNSAKADVYPILSADGSLYLSSLGHKGFGGLDIFQSKYLGDLKWGDPSNLGAPINTDSDDFGIEFRARSNSGYFTSNRSGGVGSDDIYAFHHSESELHVDDSCLNGAEEVCEYDALFSTLNADECDANSCILKVSDWTVYPNPNDGDFSFDFTVNKTVELAVRVYSSSGQMLHSALKEVAKGKNSLQFHLTGAKSGVYHLQLLLDCETLVSTKILIQN